MSRILILFFIVTLQGCSLLPDNWLPSVNVIARENKKIGTSSWELSNPAVGREIEGYASRTSINRGETIELFVNTEAPQFRLEVFRMGWYQGLGARRVFGPITIDGVVQDTPIPDVDGMVNCNWMRPYTLMTHDTGAGSDWLSGVYLAKLTTSDSGKQSYIIFVVRDDDRPAGLVYQLPVTTYQAYNFWGGKSTYDPVRDSPAPWENRKGPRARKVSFNRPYAGGMDSAGAYGLGAGEFLTNMSVDARVYPISSAGWDYNMLRWLEREGYDVAYISSLDTHRSMSILKNYKAFLSVGHDEYWSWSMRKNIEMNRDSGLNLGFFSANSVYWQVRFESDPIHGTENRVMTIYKDASEDPFMHDGDVSNDKHVTVRWREAPVDKPEEGLIGVQYKASSFVDGDIVVSNFHHPYFAGTGLTNGDKLFGLLGYEIDGRSGNEPTNTITLATSHVDSDSTANMTVYTAASGAKIFATGSMQWSWGLDDFGSPVLRTSRWSPDAQQITRNVLADFLQ